MITKNDLKTYLIGDQPTTCPYCAARTDFIERLAPKGKTTLAKLDFQLHICLNKACSYIFIAEED